MSIFQQNSRIDVSPNQCVYYIATIRNYLNNSTPETQQLSFLEQRNAPVIENCDDYLLSIMRFNIDTFTLPVFFCGIQPKQSNPNLSIYSITLDYDDKDAITTVGPYYIEWEPEDLTAQLPAAPNTTSDGYQLESPYYFAYSFGYLVKLINKTLAIAYADLQAAVPDSPELKNTNAPFMGWDSTTQTATLYCRNEIFNPNNYPFCKIYFNRALFNLYNSFPAYKLGIEPTYRKEYQIIADPNSGESITTIGLYDYIVIHQDYTTINNQTPVASIVFTSQFIPIVPTQYSNIQTYVNGQLVQLSSLGANFANVISEFASDDLAYRPTLLYNPSGNFRYYSMKNTSRLLTMDFTVWWKSKLGSLFPFYLGAGGHASIMFLFQKKNTLLK